MAEKPLFIVVFGASGDLAKKKVFPSLMKLLETGFLAPETTRICGYARSKMSNVDFAAKLRPFLVKAADDAALVDRFLSMCTYVAGQYDDPEAYRQGLGGLMLPSPTQCNRMFYFSIPPSQFVSVAQTVKASGIGETVAGASGNGGSGGSGGSGGGWSRMIVEKPFGTDLDSFAALDSAMSECLAEDQLYRIDHYLGKEMVQQLLILRFANRFLEPVWNRQYVSNVQITFKEDFGTDGRGGYFDPVGIMRDVMQNHLLQMLSIVAMEPPVRVSGDDYSNFVRDEKVKVLRSIRPLALDETVLGQYVADAAGTRPGYRDDPTVPADSKCPTFASTVVWIDNPRWEGVPFILKCGKALDERKGEIRIQFKEPPAAGTMFAGLPVVRNELVIRLQPQEAMYMKMNIKMPGLRSAPVPSEMDLELKRRYPDVQIPEAYTRLLLDVLRGQQATFVRADELRAAWEIFTPMLHAIDRGELPVHSYEYGSRGPAAADAMRSRIGNFVRDDSYTWSSPYSSSKL